MTSGLLTGRPSRNTSVWRSWYCARAVPSTPIEAPNSATGLAAKGCGVMRDSQSMAFFSTPEMP